MRGCRTTGMVRSGRGRPAAPAAVVIVEDRAATIRVITPAGPRRPRADQVLRMFDAVGGLPALESVLAAAPTPGLVVVDGTTCGELTADVLLCLESYRRGPDRSVMVLTATPTTPPELAGMADMWTVKTSEINDVADAIRMRHTASGPREPLPAGAA